MGINFHETVMGKQFYQGTMPSIARSLEVIAEELQKHKSKEQKRESDGLSNKLTKPTLPMQENSRPEKWFIIRVTGIQGHYDCETECKGTFTTQSNAIGAMHRDIAEFASKLLCMECDFEALETAFLNTLYDVEYGDYAAEVYENGKPIAIWRIGRIPV